MADEETRKKYALLSDDPVHETDREDALEFGSAARVLARAALYTRNPITIGVFGKWGSGKTSLMRLMMKIVEDEGWGEYAAVPVWFNAWQYEREEHLIIPLIATIARDIKKREEKWRQVSSDGKEKRNIRKLADKGLLILQDGGEKIHSALRSVLYGISMKGKLGVPGTGEIEISASMKDMIERYEALTQDTLMARSLYFDAFDTLHKLSKEEENKPEIVVFIDDLDRCFPEQAVRLLESIKLILHQPGFAFVLGIYPNIIEEFIRNKYAKDYHYSALKTEEANARERMTKYLDYFGDYLDKIIQVRHIVPERKPNEMQIYIRTLLEDAEVKKEFLQGKVSEDELYKLIAEVGERNPRGVVRKLNGLIVAWRIKKEEALRKNIKKPGEPENKFSLLALLINEVTGEPKYKEFCKCLSRQPRKDVNITWGEFLSQALENLTQIESKDYSLGIQSIRKKFEELSSPDMDFLITKLEQNEYLFHVLKSEAGRHWLSDVIFREELREASRDTFEEEKQPYQGVMSKEERELIIRKLEKDIIYIPGGSFTMGDGKDNDNTPHPVTLDDFEIGATPVTQEQYEAVMGSNPSSFKGKPYNPVESVSWHDAKKFCEVLTKKTGRSYTLPTEAQWEYACRAGTETNYYTGSEESDLDKAGWYNKNSGMETHPVKEKAANEFKLYDMHGNVWEWCEDFYDKDYYSDDGAGHNPEGPKKDSGRVIRGGGWNSNAGYCRSAVRYWSYPSSAGGSLGFRVVRRLGPDSLYEQRGKKEPR